MHGFGVGALCPPGTPSVHVLWTRSHKHALRVRIVCFTGVVPEGKLRQRLPASFSRPVVTSAGTAVRHPVGSFERHV